MAKRKFDPEVIKKRESSPALQPFDFLQPMDSSPDSATPAPVTVTVAPESSPSQPPQSKPKPTSKAKSTAPRAVVVSEDTPPMPRLRKTDPRVVNMIRTPIELDERLRRFVSDESTYINDTCVLAVDEFLTRRGY